MYPVTWITRSLAVGHAPMSYAELDSLREQGIQAIVNLCGEFSDLHQIERSAGFEVFWLPIADEHAPELEELEKALAWLDEAIYLGKKILVHCHHGVGRTGTLVTAYLVRRGFSVREAEKFLSESRAGAANFSQWWFLKKYGRREGRLTCTAPLPENNTPHIIGAMQEYADLLAQFALDFPVKSEGKKELLCGRFCAGRTPIYLIEALALYDKLRIIPEAAERKQLIELAAQICYDNKSDPEQNSENFCLLCHELDGKLYPFRPLSCQLHEQSIDPQMRRDIITLLRYYSQRVFHDYFALCALEVPQCSVAEAISGRFYQLYFRYGQQLADANMGDL